MSASSRFNAKQLHATGKDEILDALRDGVHEDAPFAASSSALQAANSVMLANMRARLGKDTPTPSAVYAAAMAQMQAASSAPKAEASEPEIEAAASTKEETVTPRSIAAEALAEAFRHPETEENAATAAQETIINPFSAQDISAEAEGSAILAVEHAPSPVALISPAAEKREAKAKNSKFGRKRNAVEAQTMLEEPAQTMSGQTTPAPTTPATESEPEIAATLSDSFTPAEPVTQTEPEAEPVALTPPHADGVDTQAYAEESDVTYREWQSALPPAQRSWHKMAMVAVLILAVAINAFFFMRSGPTNAEGTPAGAQIASAELDRAKTTAIEVKAKVVEVKEEVKAAMPEKTTLPPAAAPQPKISAAEPTPAVAAPAAILPPQAARPVSEAPAVQQLSPAAGRDYSGVVPPRVANEDTPLPAPHAPAPTTQLDSKQLLRVLSRP